MSYWANATFGKLHQIDHAKVQLKSTHLVMLQTIKLGDAHSVHAWDLHSLLMGLLARGFEFVMVQQTKGLGYRTRPNGE